MDKKLEFREVCIDKELEFRESHPCPEQIPLPYYPSPICDLNDKPCTIDDGYSCPWYEDYLFETRQEELDKR